MKQCKRCGEFLPLTEFYKHSKMADGHLSFCKKCTKDRVRKHRSENDSVREYDRNRYYNDPERRERTAKTSAEWRKKNPEAYAAHTAVNNAVRDGRLVKQPCEECGETPVHAHHDDYSTPLVVRWLCVRHHALHHAPDKMK